MKHLLGTTHTTIADSIELNRQITIKAKKNLSFLSFNVKNCEIWLFNYQFLI